jgi:hypothetical protein
VPPPLRPTRTRADSGCCPHESHRGLYTKQPCLASPLQISIRNRRAAKALAARRSHPPDAANCESKGGPQNSCWAALPFLGSRWPGSHRSDDSSPANFLWPAMDEELNAYMKERMRSTQFRFPKAACLCLKLAGAPSPHARQRQRSQSGGSGRSPDSATQVVNFVAFLAPAAIVAYCRSKTKSARRFASPFIFR